MHQLAIDLFPWTLSIIKSTFRLTHISNLHALYFLIVVFPFVICCTVSIFTKLLKHFSSFVRNYFSLVIILYFRCVLKIALSLTLSDLPIWHVISHFLNHPNYTAVHLQHSTTTSYSLLLIYRSLLMMCSNFVFALIPAYILICV